MDLANFGIIILSALVLAALLAFLPAPSRSVLPPRPSWPQRHPFLGGGQPSAHAWNRFHIRYYPMTLLLIAFEMEMMFMYPWAVVYVREGMKAAMEMAMFLAILSIGIVYAWREGVFRWQ